MESPCQEDIIIKCSLEEMVKEFFKDYVIVWHDPNLDSQENQEYMAQLRKSCVVLTFTEWQNAKDYIQTTKAICHVITSGTNGELLVKGISQFENLANIYVFCRNKEYHLSWAQSYEKVSCVEIQIEKVLDQIQENLLQWYQESSSLKLVLPAFAPIFNDGDKSKMNNLHRFLKVIPNFQNREQAKNDFLALSKVIYSDKMDEEHIANFEQTYNDYDKVQTLKWYTKESFLFKVTNNCLRIATSDSVQYCRLLLRDLEQAIKDQYRAKSRNFNGLLYRGSNLSEEEWKSLKENIGREIEMHGFLSVSKEKEVAERFLKKGSKRKQVFITIIVPKGPNDEEQGFAEIEWFSAFAEEKEILFNVRSRFTVLETEEKHSEDLPYRHLVLLYGAQGFRKSATQKIPIPMEKASISSSKEIMSCAHCKVQMSKIPHKMAWLSLKEKIFYCLKCTNEQDVEGPLVVLPTTTISNGYHFGYSIQISGCILINSAKTPFYGYECCKCKKKKQKRYFRCSTYSCSQSKDTYCKNCIGDCLQAQHQIILETNPYTFWCQKMTQSESSHLEFQHKLMTKSEIFQQPVMYFESQEYTKAMEYYKEYLASPGSKRKENVATAYSHMGLICQKQGEYKKAEEYNLEALELYKSVYGENHCDIAAAYYNLGRASYYKADYTSAFHYYFKTLWIYEKVYKTHHPYIATVYGSIANVCRDQGEFEKAFEYQEKALEIRKVVYGENHPHVASSYNDIGNLYDQQGEYETALQHHFKSLEIDKAIYGENHPNIAASYNNIGSSHYQQRNYNEALEYHSKALHIYKTLYEEKHPDIATCYNNIGMVKMNEGEYSEAEEYLFKALKIRESVYGENHPRVASSYNDIGDLYEKKEEYEKTLEYYLKSLEIEESVYGENHPNVLAAKQKVEAVRSELKETKKLSSTHVGDFGHGYHYRLGSPISKPPYILGNHQTITNPMKITW